MCYTCTVQSKVFSFYIFIKLSQNPYSVVVKMTILLPVLTSFYILQNRCGKFLYFKLSYRCQIKISYCKKCFFRIANISHRVNNVTCNCHNNICLKSPESRSA